MMMCFLIGLSTIAFAAVFFYIGFRVGNANYKKSFWEGFSKGCEFANKLYGLIDDKVIDKIGKVIVDNLDKLPENTVQSPEHKKPQRKQSE